MLAPSIERLTYKDADFRMIRDVIHHHAGIKLHEGKKELVYSRLAKRVRGLGFRAFSEYCDKIERDSEELLHCINSLTTNVTSFFRESHHFDFLENEVLGNADGKKVRIWSAGCSTGEEPYSIAFTCAQVPQVETEILATDLDSDVVLRAQQGIYKRKDVSGMPVSDLKRWFFKGYGHREGLVKVRDPYMKMVQFGQLNLKHDWQHQEKFDVIFCRNVMIYFDNHLRSQLLEKFHDHLKPGGYLVLGHSESLFGLSDKFTVVGKTIHQKKGS